VLARLALDQAEVDFHKKTKDAVAVFMAAVGRNQPVR
jgi:hypothetical protein